MTTPPVDAAEPAPAHAQASAHQAPKAATPSTPMPTVAVIGNPNTGKSTLFNALTGLRQKVGNYPGVTVEKHVGQITVGGMTVQLIDLPGSYSLAAYSPDEMIAVDVLLGRIPGERRPDAVLVVVDATNLRRNFYLASQVLELGMPVVIALNMIDLATARNISIDAKKLAANLGAAVVPTAAATGVGLDELRAALDCAVKTPSAPTWQIFPALKTAAAELATAHSTPKSPLMAYEIERALLDVGAPAEARVVARQDAALTTALTATRESLSDGRPLAALEAATRYRWIAEQLAATETRGTPPPSWTDRIDAVLTHPVAGLVVFVAVMALVFQAVFVGAEPLMKGIDAGFGAVGEFLAEWLGNGILASFLVDGVIAGVGAVVMFLPQILVLFLFIAILEDTGYMARAAFLMDRVMRFCGLSGQSFVPLLSSFACAVPGIMATRTIPDRRDRLATILVAPLMSCAARLPVYTILIAAFVPAQLSVAGVISVQGLVLLAMYLTGIIAAIAAATVFKRLILRGPTPVFLMELPTYKRLRFRAVAMRLWDRAKVFLVRAGTIIFVVVIVVWALGYFPRSETLAANFEAQRETARTQTAAPATAETEADAEADAKALEARLAEIDAAEQMAQLEQSVFGQIGHAVEPIFRPLGWDWRISAATIASFPAREVVVGVLGTTFALGSDVDIDDAEGETKMTHALQSATHPDGRPLFTLPVALGLMVFFALCMQCGATLATIKRETNSWGWPIVTWFYMTGLAYVAALAVVHLTTAIGL